jgi:hypothetical protein
MEVKTTLAITVCVLEGDNERCMEMDMDGCITKPMKLEEMKAALEIYNSISAGVAVPDLIHLDLEGLSNHYGPRPSDPSHGLQVEPGPGSHGFPLFIEIFP